MQGISSLCRTRLALRAAAVRKEGVQGGVQHPPHRICTQRLEGMAPVWPCLPRGLQWLSAEPSGAFQAQRLDKALGTDAKPVYCAYYAAVSGVTYLNPCASRWGNAPSATLLVVSNPLNSLLKIQHAAVAATPWKKRGMHQSYVEPDLHLGSGHVNQGDACRSRSIPLEAFLPMRAEARPHADGRHRFKSGAFQHNYSRFSLES